MPGPPEGYTMSTAPAVGDHLLEEVPPPVLFNAYKHHAGALRRYITEAARRGEPGLAEMASRLVVIGTELMDLYTGALTPEAIAVRVLAILRHESRLELDVYKAWLHEQGGYGVVTLDEDASCWVLRLGDEADRYVHVHPARWKPQTRRVRANVLKTAVMVLAYVAANGGDPADVKLVNAVRGQYLGLSPVKELTGDQGLSVVLDLLR
jgi:hypothetical protein